MYASTIVLALAGAASILAAPVSDSPAVQAAAAAAAAAPAVPLGSCPTWGGIYGAAGINSCCVYSGGPVSLHPLRKRKSTTKSNKLTHSFHLLTVNVLLQ